MSVVDQRDERKRTTDEVSKIKGWHQNWRLTVLQDKLRGNLFTGLGGVRHKGGVNLS